MQAMMERSRSQTGIAWRNRKVSESEALQASLWRHIEDGECTEKELTELRAHCRTELRALQDELDELLEELRRIAARLSIRSTPRR
ncbi:hypothetical protein [Paenibacillus sp. MBLB4367]|uniref:hypothetical protein n=1 Tax=Paenibacillus sp. MBLB4367 TaxID=3384767 RepID=UPI0039083997